MLNFSPGINLTRLFLFGSAWFSIQLVIAAIFWALWNYAVSSVFGVQLLSYGQAVALFLLIRIVLSPPKIKFEFG